MNIHHRFFFATFVVQNDRLLPISEEQDEKNTTG